MSTNQQTDKRKRADAHFRAREILKADADQARHDYYAVQAALRQRTKQLRKERLAREAELGSRNGGASARK